jgi:hypothetical protein
MGPRCIRGPSSRRTTSLASPVSAKFAAMAAERPGKALTIKSRKTSEFPMRPSMQEARGDLTGAITYPAVADGDRAPASGIIEWATTISAPPLETGLPLGAAGKCLKSKLTPTTDVRKGSFSAGPTGRRRGRSTSKADTHPPSRKALL